jgi:uncharacterized caspase-like protein
MKEKMKKTLAFLLLFFVAALLFTVQAQSTKAIRKKVLTTADSGRRSALVIGNAAYSSKPLRNPVNDARAMSSTLRELGFYVELLEDASQKEMKKAIDRFGEQLREGGIGLFYFSGHGIQVSGRNYLIPVKYTIASEDDVEYESVDAGRVLAKMKAARNGMNIVILDACRNNPFPSSFRSASQGLATINAPSGTFISYATAPGSVASDGSGKNGLYTGELIRHMKSPGLKLEEVFKKVRADVQKKSEDKQVPWDASSLTGDFYFVPPTEVPESAPVSTETVIAAPTSSKPVVAAPRKFRADEETWELVKESNDPDDFKYFLEEFPESPLSSVARLKLRKFKKAQKKLAAKQKPASSSQSTFVSSLKPINSVESSSDQNKFSIREGFEKCNGRSFCLRKVANSHSISIFKLKRMATIFGWKGAEKEQTKAEEVVESQFSETKMIREFNALSFNANKQKYQDFISKYKSEPSAKNHVTLLRKRLFALVQVEQPKTEEVIESQFSETKMIREFNALSFNANKQKYQDFISKYKSEPSAKNHVTLLRKRLFALVQVEQPEKIAKEKTKSTSKTTSLASIRHTYDKAVKQNSIFGFRNFIKEYKHRPTAKYYLSLVKKKLKKLEGVNETTNTSSSEASSGYTKRQAYLDFLEAKVSNTKTALRNFLRKHADTPDSERYRMRARRMIKNFQ